MIMLIITSVINTDYFDLVIYNNDRNNMTLVIFRM